MCGIAGFLTPQKRHLVPRTIRSMLLSMTARGPDGTSWMEWTPKNELVWRKSADEVLPSDPLLLAIGCSRLAIIDLSPKGMQPLANENQTIWAVLNGEIYNYIELRSDLINMGHMFHSLTDTEVICHAYEQWGVDCFHHFNGQFGIGIFDWNTRKLVIGRDRIGVKPLFWYKDDAMFLFGTEIKALLSNTPIPKKINHQKLTKIIGLPYKLHAYKNESLFQDIYQVMPGEFIEVDWNLNLTHKMYWQLDHSSSASPDAYETSINRLGGLLKNAVNIRLRGDRPACFLLSGGIDSSSLAGISNREFNRPVESFSLDLPDARFNENQEIIELAQFLNAKYHFVAVTPQIIEHLLPTLINICDETIPTPNGILHYLLAKKIASKEYRVILNGVGGDEVFLGYHDHFLFFLKYIESLYPDLLASELNAWATKQNRAPSIYEAFTHYLDSKDYLVSPDFLSKSNNFSYLSCLKKQYKAAFYASDDLFGKNTYDIFYKQRLDLTKLTLPHAIKMDDRFYMSQGIETRHPFLDYRIVEFGMRLSPDQKMKQGVSKRILRNAVKGYIPETRRTELKKVGLNLPLDRWMQKELRQWIDDHLRPKQNPLFEFADFKEVGQIADAHIAGKANHYLKLWDLINVNQWLTSFFY